jgi:DNA-binding NarL/FixJ family response regulator
MVITHERLSETIADVYASVGRPQSFNGVLRRIRTLLNASSGMLFTPFRDPSEGGFGFVDHVNTALFTKYRAYYWDKDPWAREGERKGLIVTGSVVWDEALISEHALGKEEIYPDLMIPMDTTRICCSIVMGDEDTVVPRTYLSVYRGLGSRPFTEEERTALQLLGPHVLQAIRLAYRLEFAESALASAYSALHEVACGVVVVDRDKWIVFMNRPAERLCSGERGLHISRQLHSEPVLRAARAQEDPAFQQAIDSAIRLFALNSCDRPRSTPVAVHGALELGPLLITALPLPPNMRRTVSKTARAVVLLEDPAQKHLAGERLFVTLFGFTSAERRVAKALLEGEHPKAIAERFDVSENTIRTHIKALYEKTNTRRMGALLSMLSPVLATRAAAAFGERR